MTTLLRSYSTVSKGARWPVDHQAHGRIWPHAWWLLAVLIAPFWAGGVSSEAQVVIGLLIAASLCLACTRVPIIPESRGGKLILGAFVAVLLASLIPLPRSLVQLLSPEAIRLSEAFPLDGQGGWLALTLAPGKTVMRLWQLAMVFGCFVLAQQAIKHPDFCDLLCHTIAAAMVFLGISEIWLLLDGRGVWAAVQNYPAGTFANRNHYANWMALGAMLCLGALLRSARNRETSRVASIILYSAALLIGISTIIMCGSRGGVLAVFAGFAAWAVILARRNPERRTLAVFGLAALAAVAAFAIGGKLLMARVATENNFAFKGQIWSEALGLWQKFPLFGIGLGSFESAFNHYKTFYGEGTFLFAENEYIEWLVETGLIGGALGLVVVAFGARRLAGGPGGKSEIYYGAVAGLVAFGAHALVEFVFHLPANSLLAATLLGLVAGLRAKTGAPVVPPLPGGFSIRSALAAGMFIFSIAALQAASSLGAWKEDSRPLASLWPLDEQRAIIRSRSILASDRSRSAEARDLLTRALLWEPYNWKLRLERAWLDLAYSADRSGAIAESRRLCALNPLQPKIPLRFANILAAVQPNTALEFLRAAKLTSKDEIKAALRIAWTVEKSPPLLWELTPATSPGLKGLAEVAEELGLVELSAEAGDRLTRLASKGVN